MLFNSLEFIIFLPIVFAMYWIMGRSDKKLQLQNAFLVLASYIFYGWWDWRFLGLIAFSTLVDFYVGKAIHSEDSKLRKKLFLAVSLFTNLGLLAYFKYANFFIESWVDAWAGVGVETNVSSLYIILPVGISFYTFQTLSYSIDIYREKLKPTKDPIAFAAFVSFFPQLVAGPIERASKLLPQIERTRTFDKGLAISGLRLMLWGMFKKVVVADSCAKLADTIFDSPESFSGPTLMLGVLYFAFQIYGDFSGYSDIAIGTGRLFGIRLSTNFKFPYFSRDIGEFWRRWHISLSTWFRDYLYIPLGGSRGTKLNMLRNVSVIFIVSGFWHGANWTFVMWGAIHAALFIPLVLLGRNRKYTSDVVAEGHYLPKIKEVFSMASTFAMVCFAWIFFRADSISGAFMYISGFVELPSPEKPVTLLVYSVFFWISVMIIVDWFQRSGEIPKWWLSSKALPIRWFAYAICTWLCLKNLQSEASFIYFQF
ncbi:MAG: membrane-bound O-acyltransferase family protein [Bacteroidetes bacterium]|nr:MAG: membrane-bound O-acyltransferase family protein [Bacteroidota bacterium]